MQTLAQAIRKDDSLTKVTVHVGAGGEQHPQLAAVKIACALKGVELEVTKDIRVLRTISVSSLYRDALLRYSLSCH